MNKWIGKREEMIRGRKASDLLSIQSIYNENEARRWVRERWWRDDDEEMDDKDERNRVHQSSLFLGWLSRIIFKLAKEDEEDENVHS